MLQEKNEKMEEYFYQASERWTYDMYQSQTVWLRRALIALVVLSVLLFFSLLSNLFLFPLKQNVPYLYAFNNATGEVTKLGKLEPSSMSGNWQVTQFFIAHYVENREGYDFYNMDRPYQLAWATSSIDVRRQYDNQVDTNVNTSPYKTYGKDSYVTVDVLDVTPLNDDTVEVRFNKVVHSRDDSSQTTEPFEAIIRYQYMNETGEIKMLDRDPLGFQVTYYQSTPVTPEKTQ